MFICEHNYNMIYSYLSFTNHVSGCHVDVSGWHVDVSGWHVDVSGWHVDVANRNWNRLTPCGAGEISLLDCLA
jgi:uncharacterized membrane protein